MYLPWNFFVINNRLKLSRKSKKFVPELTIWPTTFDTKKLTDTLIDCYVYPHDKTYTPLYFIATNASISLSQTNKMHKRTLILARIYTYFNEYCIIKCTRILSLRNRNIFGVFACNIIPSDCRWEWYV